MALVAHGFHIVDMPVDIVRRWGSKAADLVTSEPFSTFSALVICASLALLATWSEYWWGLSFIIFNRFEMF